METLSSKEFFEQLKTNSLKQPPTIKGIVKKAGKDSEVLFTRKGDFSNWITIPDSMIESVKLIKTFTKEDKLFAVVKLQLKTPSNTEGKVLYDLLSLTEKSENKEYSKKGEEGHVGNYCTCGCHDHGYGACGCHCGCGCGCHGHTHCQCGCGCHEHAHGECGCESHGEQSHCC